MKGSTKTYLTAGVALVGAGVIAASPIAPIPANYADASRSYDVALMAAAEPTEAQREIRAAMALLEGFESGGTLNAFIEGIIEAFERPGPVPYTPVDGPIEALGRIGQGFAASGLRLGATALAPLRLIELAQAIAEGNGAEGFAALVENIVDAPLWVVDPALYGLRDALPAPLGGPDGIIADFRYQLWRLTEEINAGLQDPGAAVQGFVQRTIEAFERPGPVEYEAVTGPIDGLSRVAEGAIATVLRIATATVLGPVGVVQAAVAFAQGDTAEALARVEDLVDGPLWAVDPALYGLRDALPAPLGGPNAFVENFRNGLWSATEQINGAIRDIVNRGQAATEADVTPPAETFSEPSISSTPDSQARLVNLPKQESNENELDNLPQQDQRKDSKLDSTSRSGLLGSKEENPLASARNLVRNSLNFSPGAKRTDQNPTGEAGNDVVKTTTPEETDTTRTTDTTNTTDTTRTTDTTQNAGTTTGGKKPGGSEQGGSGGDK